MRGHGGPHILQQRLQLRVVGRRNQPLVDRIEDSLVIRDLAVHVGAVERGSVQRLELLARIGRRSLQRLADGVVLWGDSQLARQRRRLRVHGCMVGDHCGRELFDARIVRARLREFRRVDIDVVRRDGDMGNFGIRQIGRSRRSWWDRLRVQRCGEHERNGDERYVMKSSS